MMLILVWLFELCLESKLKEKLFGYQQILKIISNVREQCASLLCLPAAENFNKSPLVSISSFVVRFVSRI
jgi:hypothetical protein